MRVFLLAVAAQALSLAKPEAALLQEAAQTELATGDTVNQLLTNMLNATVENLKKEQDDLATTVMNCNQDNSEYEETVTAETKQKALAMASMEAFAAREGALTAKVETLKKRSQDSEAAFQDQVDQTNAALTAEYNEAVVEAQVLANALTVLTNKKAMMQTGAGAQTSTMSSEMKTKLHDVIAKKTNVVDADTVMLAISESKNSYTNAVGEQGGFGTVVGIVMSLKNTADQNVAKLSVKLEEWNSRNANQLALREKMRDSDLLQYTDAQENLLDVHQEREGATTEFDRAKTKLSFTQQKLAKSESECNSAKIAHNKFIREAQNVIQTLHSVLAQLDKEFSQSGFIQLPSFVQLEQPTAHAHVDHGFSRVCAMLDRMVQATANKKAEFIRGRDQCNVMMTNMVSKINGLDQKIDDIHQHLHVINLAIRGGTDADLDHQIEDALPADVIQLKVDLQTKSNIRKINSQANADTIETNKRYIQECKDAITKLKHIAGYTTNSTASGEQDQSIAAIISGIESLSASASMAITQATETEKGQHEDYMDFVGVTNEEISATMMDIANMRGQRAQKLGDELEYNAQAESLINTHSNLGIDFLNSCGTYGQATFEHESGEREHQGCTGSGCTSYGTMASCNAVAGCTWRDASGGGPGSDDGHAHWNLGTGVGQTFSNDQKIAQWTDVGNDIAFLMGKLQCTEIAAR